MKLSRLNRGVTSYCLLRGFCVGYGVWLALPSVLLGGVSAVLFPGAVAVCGGLPPAPLGGRSWRGLVGGNTCMLFFEDGHLLGGQAGLVRAAADELGHSGLNHA